MYIIKYITYCSFFVTLFFLANCQRQQSRGTTNSPFIRPTTKQNFKKKYMPLYNEKYIEKAKYNSRGRSVGEAIEDEKYYPEIHNQNVYRSMDGGEHSLLPTSPNNQNMNSTSSMSPNNQMANGRQQTSRHNFHTSSNEGDRLYRNRNYTPQNFRSYDLHASEKVTHTSSSEKSGNTNTHYSNTNPESMTHYSNTNPGQLYSNEHNIHEQSYVTTNLRSNPWRKKSKRIADKSLRLRSHNLLTDPDPSSTSSQNKSNFNSIPNQFPQNSIHKIIENGFSSSVIYTANEDPILITGIDALNNRESTASINALNNRFDDYAINNRESTAGINALNNRKRIDGINTFNNRFDDYAINNRFDEYNEKYQLSSAEDNKNLVTYAFENYEDNLNMRPLSFNNKLSRKLRVSKVNYRRKSIKIALNNFSLRS